MDLDQPESFGEVDPGDALGATLAAPEQWARAGAHQLRAPADVDAVVVVGMGGSGIVGDLVAAVAADRLAVPVTVHKDANLPAFVGPRTLVCAVSHSGGTQETLAATDQALDAGAQVIAVTSGGPLAQRVRAAGQTVVTVPAGGQPRHALGHLAGPLLVALGLEAGLAEAVTAMRRVAQACAPGVPRAANPAKALAQRVAQVDLVVVWGAGPVTGVVARRLTCQLNEHAKMPAYPALLPELTHNEIVGWEQPARHGLTAGLVVVGEAPRRHGAASERVQAACRLVASRFAWVEQWTAQDAPALVRMAPLLLSGDLASVYAAIARDVDPTPIASIDRLKSAMAAPKEQH